MAMISRQALRLSRVWAAPAAGVADPEDLALMRRIDELFMAWPFLGSWRMALMLSSAEAPVNRKRVQRLMRRMGIAALGPRPRTSIPAPGHRIYPYLLRNLTIDRPGQVWAADITYIPMGRGFFHLMAVIEWASRAVLAWRLSNTMHVTFCLEALEAALADHRPGPSARSLRSLRLRTRAKRCYTTTWDTSLRLP
jgi:putative transposase